MKLSKLLQTLIKMQDPDIDHEVSIMQELEAKAVGEIQAQSQVENIAFSKRSGIIIIGKELD